MRQRTIIDLDALSPTSQRWDNLLAGLLIAMLFFMPAAFGAVEAWSQLIVFCGAAALAIALALRPAFDRDFRFASTWTYVPLALFISFVALQILPLPIGLAGVLSPATVSTKQEMLDKGFEALQTTTLSFYPHATVEMLRLVFVGATVFVTVASVFRSRRQISFLLTAIFAVGCAEACLSLAQIATASELIYWSIPVSGAGVVTSGSFVNYSHFCQFMNLSIGAGLALLLIQLHERRRHDSGRRDWLRPMTRINWDAQGWLIAGLVLCAIAVCTSMSRNGVISMVVATGVIGVALFRRGSLSWQGWLLGAVPFGVLVMLLVFGFDRVFARLTTLQHTQAYESRWELFAATLRAWRTYPIFGTGLGTHEFIFPMFDTTITPTLAAHADNDYAQLLEETGIVGAALVVAFLAGMAALAIKLAFRGRGPCAAASFGLAFGLLAVAIHSASDFGQRIPAIFCLSATLCGLLVSTTRLEAQSRNSRPGRIVKSAIAAPWARRVAASAAVIGMLAVWGWALRGAYAAHLGERWWAASYVLAERIQQDPNQGTDEDYIDLIAAAERARASDPSNATYGYWLAYYRWESMSRTISANQQQTILTRDALTLVARIADELAQVRAICPTYGPPYALEGQLRLNVLSDARGAELIRKGLRLAPYDPPTCLVAGELAAREGNVDEAKRLLTRAVSLQSTYYSDVINIYLFDLELPDLARELAGDDYIRLEELAAVCASNEVYARLAKELRAAAEANLRLRTAADDAPSRELAALADIDFNRRQFDSAIALYRRALSKEYRQLKWRLNLAHALAETGKIDQGIHELRICLRLRPNNSAAKRLLETLLPQAAATPSKKSP